jgi:hypothetical protein
VVDLFDEVEEELRSERYKRLALKVAPIAIGVAVLALAGALGFWGWDSYQNRQIAKVSDAYSAAVAARDANEAAKAETEFKLMSQNAPPAYKAFALMQLGALALEKNDAKGAAALFDQAADTRADEMITDIARLKSAFALMDTASYAETEAKLKPLTEDDRPYRTVAKEALAFAKVQAGNLDGARADFSAMTVALDSSEAMRDRASKMVQLIDAGTAKSMPEAAKAAMALPVMPAMPQLQPSGTAQ